MTNKGKSFWCERWHQQIYEHLCIHRYKKGLKKCEGCGKGAELLSQEIRRLRHDTGRLKSQDARRSGG